MISFIYHVGQRPEICLINVVNLYKTICYSLWVKLLNFMCSCINKAAVFALRMKPEIQTIERQRRYGIEPLSNRSNSHFLLLPCPYPPHPIELLWRYALYTVNSRTRTECFLTARTHAAKSNAQALSSITAHFIPRSKRPTLQTMLFMLFQKQLTSSNNWCKQKLTHAWISIKLYRTPDTLSKNIELSSEDHAHFKVFSV